MKKITVPARPGLDPVYAYFDDIAAGEGRVILVCWDMAYTAYWGAMGDRTTEEFFAGCGTDYLAARFSGRHYKAGKIDLNYLDKVVKAVHEHLNAQKAVA